MEADGIGFDTLLTKNVPHIIEKIFLSLDYQSFKRCQVVSNKWSQLLTSDSLKAKAKSVFYGEISEELFDACIGECDHDDCDCESECDHGDIECEGNADEVKRLLSSGMVDVNCMMSLDIGGDGVCERTPLNAAGMNCIKIGLPGKLILSERKSLLEVRFS